LENEAWEISREMNDVLTPATCDLNDDSRRWQDIENEIPIAQWGRRILAVFAHCARAFLKRRPQAPATTSRASGRWPEAPTGALRSFCRLQDRFNKSLSMSGEVSSLAGDRVVSHERYRPADLPRQDL
jgi:hypothetical protein